MIRAATAERIGILGGTLDPVHVGHVEAAQAARRALNLTRVVIMPSRVPPHRAHGPSASAFHRFAMAALAVQDEDGITVSDEELCLEGPSYTAPTLERIGARGISPTQIFFITGADAFAEIETWYRYPRVLDLAHFVVISRPGWPAARVGERLPDVGPRLREAASASAVLEGTAVFLVNAPTPAVSSTEIRQRLRTGGSIRGLVPAAVEAHIRRHALYSDSSSADHLQ